MSWFKGFDVTYCNSKKCENKCERKPYTSRYYETKLNRFDSEWQKRLKWTEFCDENGEVKC